MFTGIVHEQIRFIWTCIKIHVCSMPEFSKERSCIVHSACIVAANIRSAVSLYSGCAGSRFSLTLVNIIKIYIAS